MQVDEKIPSFGKDVFIRNPYYSDELGLPVSLIRLMIREPLLAPRIPVEDFKPPIKKNDTK